MTPPAGASPVNLHDFETLARARLDDNAWAYLAGGAADELTLTDNPQAWQRLHLAPRVLRRLAGGHTRSTLLGRPLACPILPAANNPNGPDVSLQGEAVGSRPGLTPEHSGTVWTTYQLSPNWRAGGGLNWRSAVAPQLVTTFEAPGYVTADLMAEYTVGDLSYKFNLSNLSNKLYADMLYRGHYIPGKGRTAQLTASYRF